MKVYLSFVQWKEKTDRWYIRSTQVKSQAEKGKQLPTYLMYEYKMHQNHQVQHEQSNY